MHRERKGLIAFVLCVAALAVSQRSVADIRSIPLLPREDPRLLELTDGRFAVLSAETAYAHATGPVPVARHHTIQIAELSGKLHPPVPVPMRGYPEAVVPFHQGIVFWERNRGRSEVRYFDLKEGLRDSALYTASDIDYLYLSASPRGDALYVTESLRGGGSRLTRLDTNGRSLWSRVFAHISSNVVALPDGAVFAAASPTPTDFYSGALTRLDNDGEQQWQVPVLIGGGVPQVLRHSGNVIGVVARNAQGELELANHAEDSGREISRAIIPSDSHLTGTPDGVLFYRDFLYQPYLGMIGSDGSMRWWRRFRVNETVGDPGPIVLSRKGELVFIAGYQQEPSGPTDHRLVFVDREARALNAFGECTRLDPRPLLQLESALGRDYSITVSPDYSLLYTRRSQAGCPPPTEHEYAAALRSLQSDLASKHVARVHGDEGVYVTFMGGGQEIELVSYNMGMPASHSPVHTLQLQARVDAAASLAVWLRESVFPHIDRVRRARERFRKSTGQMLVLLKDSGAASDPAAFLQQVERAQQTVEEKIQALGPGRFAGERAVARLAVKFDASGNGRVNDQPLENADQAFLQAMEEGKRRYEERLRELQR